MDVGKILLLCFVILKLLQFRKRGSAVYHFRINQPPTLVFAKKYRNRNVDLVRKERPLPAVTPAARVIIPRRSSSSSHSVLKKALEGRSKSTVAAAEEHLSKLPERHLWNTENILSILLASKCQLYKDDDVCGGTLEIRQRETRVSGEQLVIQVQCKRCGGVTEYTSHENTVIMTF